jgi:hypothetical protein
MSWDSNSTSHPNLNPMTHEYGNHAEAVRPDLIHAIITKHKLANTDS